MARTRKVNEADLEIKPDLVEPELVEDLPEIEIKPELTERQKMKLRALGLLPPGDDYIPTFLFVSQNNMGSGLVKAAAVTIPESGIAGFDASGNAITDLTALKIGIEAVQEGSGDPSGDNIRPINGWSEAKITRTGKNLFSYDLPIRDGYWNTPTTFSGSNNIIAKENATLWQYIRIYVEGLSQITLSGFDTQGGVYCAWLGSEDVTDIISTFSSGAKNGTKTVPSGAKYLGLVIFSIKNANTNYPNAQLEVGSTATAYEPYTARPYTIDLAGTCYGGSLDVFTGKLSVTWDYIETYAGEELPGVWVSDRDVYVEGNSPTTGAEVIYELAEPIEVDLDPVDVRALNGYNNIWADCGPVTELEYSYSPKIV